MSNLFRGYSQGSSVESNKIKVKDPSEQILREAQVTLAQWSKRVNAEEGARNRHLQYRQDVYQKEKEQRAIQRETEREFAKSFRDAVQYNNDVKIKSATDAVRNAKSGLIGQLAELAPTAGKIWNDIDAKREKDGTEFGRALVAKYGISSQEYDDFHAIKGNIRDFENKNISVINKILERGGNWDEIEAIRNLSGYQRLGLRQGEAIRGGENYQSWMNQQYGKKIELPNGLGNHSIASAVASDNPQILGATLESKRSEYLRQFKHLDEVLVAEYMRDKFVSVEGRYKSFQQENRIKRIQKKQAQEDENSVVVAFKEGGFEGLQALTQTWSGVDGEYMSDASNRVHGHVLKAIEKGVLNAEHVQQIKEGYLTPKGEKSQVKYEERFPQRAREMDDALMKADKILLEKESIKTRVKEQKERLKTDGLEQAIIADWENTSQEDLMEMFRVAASSGNNSMQKMLQRRMTLSPTGVNDTVNIPHLQKLQLNGMLTRRAVLDAQLSPEKTIKWLKTADALNPFKPTDEEDKSFKQEATRAIENILHRYGKESKHVQSSSLAVSGAHQSMRKYFKQSLLKTNGDRAAAKDLAIQMFNQDIDAGKIYQIAEVREDVPGRPYEPHFKNFQLNPIRISYPLSEYTTESVRQNPEIYKEQLIIPEDQIRQFVSDVTHGRLKGFPPLASHFVNKYTGLNPDGTVKITELEFMKGQAELLGLEIPENYFIINDAAINRIDPKFRRYLSLGPGGVDTALHYSGLSSPNYNHKPTGTKYSSTIYGEEGNMSEQALAILGGR